MPTIQELAKDYSLRFEGATRPDGSSFRRVKGDEKSEELTALIMAAHNGMLPDDHRYAMIEAALDAIAEDGEDAQLEPYVYTHELTAWVHSNGNRLGYCDDAIEEYGGRPETAFDMLQWGMACEQREVLGSVLESLKKLAETLEEANA